jgi:hypothetical protein
MKKERENMGEIMGNEGPAMKQIMKLLGMEEMAVTAFTLTVRTDMTSVVVVTYYPDKDHLGMEPPITKAFRLVTVAEEIPVIVKKDDERESGWGGAQ